MQNEGKELIVAYTELAGNHHDEKFEEITTFVPDLSSFVGKEVHEVIRYLHETYGDRYYLPAKDYWEWLRNHRGQIPEELKGGKYYFIPIAVFRIQAGRYRVHFGGIEGTDWRRHDVWASSKWHSFYRAILIEI